MNNFKIIPNFENYGIDKMANVINFDTGKLLKPSRTDRGYLFVRLYKDNLPVSWRLHRLMLFTYVGASEKEVHHINSVRDDNRLENLAYLTHSENMSEVIWKVSEEKKRKISQSLKGTKKRKLISRALISLSNSAGETIIKEFHDWRHQEKVAVNLLLNGKYESSKGYKLKACPI